jgi:hypothetical protein
MGISLRKRRSAVPTVALLRWIAIADPVRRRQHVRPGVLIRQWIEQQRDAAEAADAVDLPARVERLEAQSSATR